VKNGKQKSGAEKVQTSEHFLHHADFQTTSCQFFDGNNTPEAIALAVLTVFADF